MACELYMSVGEGYNYTGLITVDRGGLLLHRECKSPRCMLCLELFGYCRTVGYQEIVRIVLAHGCPLRVTPMLPKANTAATAR